MRSIFIFRRDLRLTDNTTLIHADKIQKDSKIIPIFIFDPYQINDKNKSDNCVQFMVESLKDLNSQLRKYGSKLYTFFGKPWDVVSELIAKENIDNVYTNMDYTVYSKYRDNKIKIVCEKNKINFVQLEDCMLNNINSIKTETNKFYEKFTPYYIKASKNTVNLPTKHIYKNLIKNYTCPLKQFTKVENLFTENPDIYVHGGRTNAIQILKNIKEFSDYNNTKNEPIHDTTIMSPHNKFGTVSIREFYHMIKNKLGKKNELLRQLYWRDFYYNQMYFNENYFALDSGRYKKIKWNNNSDYFNKWKNGQTGIPIVDAGMIQLNKTGWIHNRIRMLVATTLTKILLVDWRLGEKYFKKKLIDYDVSQNIMNWFWISGETVFANPYFRVLNPIIQTEKHDKNNEYIKKWNDEKNLTKEPIVDVQKMIKKSIKMYS